MLRNHVNDKMYKFQEIQNLSKWTKEDIENWGAYKRKKVEPEKLPNFQKVQDEGTSVACSVKHLE